MFSLETKDFSIEKRYIRKDGEEIQVFLHAIGIRDAEGNVRFGIAFADDITERKKAEEQIIKDSARENLIRLIKEILSNNVFVLNFKTTDLINFFHNTIDSQKVNSIQNIKTSKERVTFLTELNLRVSVKDKSITNLMNLIIKSELEQHEEQLQILKRSIKIFDEMKKLIDNYEYDFDRISSITNTNSTSNCSSTTFYFRK
jgi:hypothetical protein